MAGVLSYALSLKTSGFTGPMASASKALGTLGSAAGKTAALVAKVGTAVGALAGGVSVFAAMSKAADMEQLNVSLGVLIGNAEETATVLGELRQFANVTPFSTRDVLDAGKNLIALGSDTKTLTAELRALGDVSAGMSVPLGDMVEIYGKARTQGTLFAEDLNQLAGRGVPIFQKLAGVLGVSTSEVKKLASEGQITFPMLQKVFSDLTGEGGKFYEMMAKQSGTTKGLLSTLKSSLDELLITIGTPINDFLKPIIAGNIARMQALNQRVAAFLQLLSAAKEQGKLGEFLGSGFKVAIIEGINLLSSGVRGVVGYLAAALPPVFSAAMEILTSERTQLFFQSLFRGAGEYISAAIADALSILPGLSSLKDQAEASRVRGSNYFTTASAGLQSADFGAVLDKMSAAMSEANAAGVQAFKDASGKPLIDPSIARDEFKDIAGALDKEALDKLLNPPVAAVTKQLESLEDALGGLNVGLKAATPKPAKPAKDAGGAGFGNADGQDQPRRIRLLDAASSAASRLSRRSAADAARDARLGRDGLTQADKLGFERGAIENPDFPIAGLADVASRLSRGNRNADPGRVRREEKAEANRKAADPMYRVVKNIEETFANLATA